MPRWMYFLLLALPATFLAEALHASPVAVFLLAAMALVPLAGLIGLATEALAERLNYTLGGLLNATFGNAAELIIGITALSAGLTQVVIASITGSIIGNVLLVLGMSMFAGGLRHGAQLFSKANAGHYAVMMAIAVVGMALNSRSLWASCCWSVTAPTWASRSSASARREGRSPRTPPGRSPRWRK